MDYFLKANTEAELWSTLTSVGIAEEYHVKDSEGNVTETRHRVKPEFNVDVIGTISRPTGNVVLETVGDRNVEVPEMEELEGFHANLRGPGDFAPVVTYIDYVPTEEERDDPNFVMPRPTQQVTPSPISNLLVYPKAPHRVWF